MLATKDTKFTKGCHVFCTTSGEDRTDRTRDHRRRDRCSSCARTGIPREDYQEALCLELHARGLAFERERAIVVQYRGTGIPGQRIDLIVGDCVLVELKAMIRIDMAHEAKVISYLRTTGLRLGLLLNFNGRMMKEGIKRIAL